MYMPRNIDSFLCMLKSDNLAESMLCISTICFFSCTFSPLGVVTAYIRCYDPYVLFQMSTMA